MGKIVKFKLHIDTSLECGQKKQLIPLSILGGA